MNTSPGYSREPKVALYQGCYGFAGHYLFERVKAGGDAVTCWQHEVIYPKLPWKVEFMDGGLLDNGKRADVYDGKVFWTYGGRVEGWFAFVWWDRSVDRRHASNSGFYVRGFECPSLKDPNRDSYVRAAFEFACQQWPHVVERQAQPLVLQL